ncbi:hypothetical protein FTO65_18315 [Bacillus cereus]|nr:hypothetical protein [Bacillus cereus]
MGDRLPVKARLVRANNQWGMKNPPLIKVSLYFIIPLPLHFLNKKRLSNRIASYTSIFRNIV